MNSAHQRYPRDAMEEWLRQSGQAREDNSASSTIYAALKTLIDIVFFASLESEEGSPTRVRIVYHQQGIEGLRNVTEEYSLGSGSLPIPAWQILPLEQVKGVTELSVKSLAKIAPAASLPRTFVVVGRRDGQFEILGLARRVEYSGFGVTGEDEAFVLRATRPGHLVLSHQDEDRFLYENGVVVEVHHKPALHRLLRNDESVIRTALRALCPESVDGVAPRRGFKFDGYRLISQALIGFTHRMTTGAHGGLLAILPLSANLDVEAAKGKYRFSSPHRRKLCEQFAEVAKIGTDNWSRLWEYATPEGRVPLEDLHSREMDQHSYDLASTELEALIENIGQLSTIDNALLLGPELEVLCAGYPVASLEEPPKVFVSTSLKGDPGKEFPLLRHGSRHRAAANFAHQFPGGMAFLCSQDGDLRCLHRVQGQDHVLLWNLSSSDW